MWDEQKEQQLKALFEAGLSFAQISEQIAGVTRSACIGKAQRLGLTVFKVRPRTPEERERRRQRDNARKAEMRTRRGEPPRKPTLRPVTTPRVVDSGADVALHLTLLDLESHHCRFPYGGNNGVPFTFCGHQKTETSSYCARHQALCQHEARKSTREVFYRSNKMAARSRYFAEAAE